MINNPMQMLEIMNSLSQNPMAVLSKFGLNIPNGLNNPQDIIQHLLNSGQISQAQVNQAKQLQSSPMFKNLFKR